jgi:hypothetical protein
VTTEGNNEYALIMCTRRIYLLVDDACAGGGGIKFSSLFDVTVLVLVRCSFPLPNFTVAFPCSPLKQRRP